MQQLKVFITRAQPFHLGHEAVVEHAMQEIEKTGGHLVIFIGSSNKSREFKNPFTFNERIAMVENRYKNHDNIHIAGLQDFDYDDNGWECNFHYKLLQIRAELFLGQPHKVTLLSSVKGGDDILRASWARDIEVVGLEPRKSEISGDVLEATDVRAYLAESSPHSLSMVLSKPVRDVLGTMDDALDCIERTHKEVEDYKKLWGKTPFPVQFAATDAVVRDVNGDILMIERGGDYGIGKRALVGGFLEHNLTNEQNMKKELLEEVNLDLDTVPHRIVLSWHCDAVGRASRGRMTTTVFLIQLDVQFADLNLVAGDDAAGLGWAKPQEYLKMDLFNDHAGLIRKVLHLEELGVRYVPHS